MNAIFNQMLCRKKSFVQPISQRDSLKGSHIVDIVEFYLYEQPVNISFLVHWINFKTNFSYRLFCTSLRSLATELGYFHEFHQYMTYTLETTRIEFFFRKLLYFGVVMEVLGL